MRHVIISALLLAAPLTQAADRVPPPLTDHGKTDKIRLVYYVPADREPTANWKEKITTLMTFVADLYREDFKARGWAGGELDFFWENGVVKVELLRSLKKTADVVDGEINSQKQWPIVSEEVAAAYGSPSRTATVVFTECYGDGPAEFEWPGGIALGARFSAKGGLGVFSSWVLRDDFCATTTEGQLKLLADDTPIQGRVANHNRRPNSPRYEFIEDGFGAVAHELGHALGLPHDQRDDRHDIMGNGFRYLRQNYLEKYAAKGRVGFSEDNARMLSHTRHLADKPTLEDNEAPKLKVSMPTPIAAGTTELKITVEGTDNTQLGAVLFKHKQAGDSVIGGAALTGTSETKEVTLKVPPLKPGTFGLRLIVTDHAGNTSGGKLDAEVK